MIVEAIIGSITALTLGSLWFAKWVLASQETAEAQRRKEERKEDERLDAEEKAEREANDPEVKAAKKAKADAEAARLRAKEEAEAAETKQKNDEQKERRHKISELRSKTGMSVIDWCALMEDDPAICPHCSSYHYWTVKARAGAPQYCECDELVYGHFHAQCKAINSYGVVSGCHAMYLMLAKNVALP